MKNGMAEAAEPDGSDFHDGGAVDDYEIVSSVDFTVETVEIVKLLQGTSATHTSGSNVTIGEQVTYTITVTLPEGGAPSLTITDNLPDGMAYVAGTASIDSSGFNGSLPAPTFTATPGGDGDDIIWDFGPFTVTEDGDPDNNSFIISLQATVMDNPANVGVTGLQTDLDNTVTLQIADDTPYNTAPVTVTVVEPLMAIVKEFDTDTATPNDTITVTLTVTNTGLSNAFEVIVTDPISNTLFHSISEGSTPTDYTFSAPVVAGETIVTYTGADGSYIAPGSSETFTFSMTLQPDLAPSPPPITNTATVTQATTLDNLASDGDKSEERDEPDVSDSDTLTVLVPDLQLTKSNDVTLVSNGELIIYDIVVTNIGTQTATGVVITDTVPDNSTFDLADSSATWNSCADNAAAGTVCSFNIGTLGVGISQTVQFAIELDNPVLFGTSAITNTAVTQDDGTQGDDPTPLNNSDTHVDQIRAGIGDYIWADNNANGVQDGGDTPLAGVTVELFSSGGSLISTTTSLADGSYAFLDIDPGDYYLIVTPPASYVISPQNQGSDDTLDSDIDPDTGQTANINLTAGEYDSTWDGGLYQPATIGDIVWLDADQDGIQDGDEYGIPGITVEIFDATDALISSTITLADGSYQFVVPPGDYYINLPTLGSYTITTQDAGTDDALDSDIDVATSRSIQTYLAPGETDNTWDAGLYVPPASLGDTVWLDADQDGIQDSDEFGIPGVTVNLYDGSNNLLGSTTTDDDGAYQFTNLPPGDYVVEVESPTGYTITTQDAGTDDALDSDIAVGTGRTVTITLASNDDDPDWDAGLYILPATIGDLVWLDADQDGIQDGDEFGIADVAVSLYNSSGTLIATTTTDNMGAYAFNNLVPGDYYLEFTPPAGYGITTQNAGSDAVIDSDINPLTGETAVTTLRLWRKRLHLGRRSDDYACRNRGHYLARCEPGRYSRW